MRVLHLIDSVGVYGAEVMLLHLVAEQIKQGFKPIIASIGEKGIDEKQLEAEARKRGFRVKKFRMIPGPNYLGAFEILRFAWHERVNILHSHGYKGNILFGLLPKKIRKIPMITTVHGYTSTGNSYSRMRAYEWLDSKVLRFMDAVVFVSNAMRSDPRFKHLNPSKIHVIHNGIPLSTQQTQRTQRTQVTHRTEQTVATQQTQATAATHDLDPEILRFCRQGFTLGSIGRLSPEKGYIYLIDALKIIRDEGYDVRLVIIGEGGERNSLENKTKELGLESYVMLPGYKENASSYLSYFDIFVLPSLTEGLPMTILEAMRAGVPIVATSVGGIPEVLSNGETGILVEMPNATRLAKAITDLIDDAEKRSRLGQRAMSTIRNKCSAILMAKSYTELYNSTLKHSSISIDETY